MDIDERYKKMQINSGEQENTIYNFIRNVMRMQTPNAYFICFLWSSKDWKGTLYASTRVLGIEWLLYMPHWLEFHRLNGYCICILRVVRSRWFLSICPLELRGLGSYYICVLSSFEVDDVLRNVPKTFLCFNTWDTNLGKILYSHLIKHRHCYRISTW